MYWRGDIVLHAPVFLGQMEGRGEGRLGGQTKQHSLHMPNQSVPPPKQKKHIDRHSFTAHSVEARHQTLPETHFITRIIDKLVFMVLFLDRNGCCYVMLEQGQSVRAVSDCPRAALNSIPPPWILH